MIYSFTLTDVLGRLLRIGPVPTAGGARRRAGGARRRAGLDGGGQGEVVSVLVLFLLFSRSVVSNSL